MAVGGRGVVGPIFLLLGVGIGACYRPSASPLLRSSRLLSMRTRAFVTAHPADQPDEGERDWDAALRNLTAQPNATRPPSPEDEPVYKIASSRERLAESRKKYVDTMNDREERLVTTWGSEKGLLGALAVVGVILCFYIYIGVSGGLSTPRPDILVDDPSVSSAYDAGERLLQSTR